MLQALLSISRIMSFINTSHILSALIRKSPPQTTLLLHYQLSAAVLLHIATFCQSQTLNFNCDFDGTLTGDCKFTTTTGGPAMSTDAGAYSPSANPKIPYSDAKAVRKHTSDVHSQLITSLLQGHSRSPTMSRASFLIRFHQEAGTCTSVDVSPMALPPVLLHLARDDALQVRHYPSFLDVSLPLLTHDRQVRSDQAVRIWQVGSHILCECSAELESSTVS